MDSVSAFFDKVAGALLSFNFMSDLLDILLVTIVIYEFIKLIRGSRTFQLIKGVAFLAILYVLVKVCGMEASEYLLSALFENGLIILVVIFAPDIRKILERFGRQSIKDFSFLNLKNDIDYEKKVSDTINEFCKAATELSESKTGALVVFEKDSPLQDIADTGTILDAKASAELFNGLFFKNSALHDGAVIVKDGKINAAGCILPLTQNPTLASELGTRHRAAIGMSEHCDAVVVVVSEETGSISFAKNGELTRDVSSGALRELLLSELIASDDKSSAKDKKKIFSRRKNNGGDTDESEKDA